MARRKEGRKEELRRGRRRSERGEETDRATKKRKRKRMVLVQRGPQDTGKEYPRTVEDASLPSSSSSRPPLRRVSFLFSSACLPSVLLSLFSPCKYAPSDSHKDLYSQREPSSPSNATHQEGYHLPLSFPLSLSLSLRPDLYSISSSSSYVNSLRSPRVFHPSPPSTCRETFARITKSRGLVRGLCTWRGT